MKYKSRNTEVAIIVTLIGLIISVLPMFIEHPSFGHALFLSLFIVPVALYQYATKSECALEIQSNGILLTYFMSKKRFIPFNKISRALYNYPFRNKFSSWRLCFEYNNCQEVVSKVYFSRDQRREISLELYRIFLLHGISVQAHSGDLEYFEKNIKF